MSTLRVVCSTLLLALAGCATTPATNTFVPPLHDDAFQAHAPVPLISTEDLFALDPELTTQLRAYSRTRLNEQLRIEVLLSKLFGKDHDKFPYVGGHSTIARETWIRHAGDCLSLTVLAFAMARELGLDAHIQEVKIPVLVNRVNSVDMVVGHVNLVIKHHDSLMVDARVYGAGDLMIDFEPSLGGAEHGTVLTEADVLARLYNNHASEAFATGDIDKAYSLYQAAIRTSPAYAASYGNLAQVYLRRGFGRDAESLLDHALVLEPDNYSALYTLRDHLQTTGRPQQARQIADRIARLQDEDPYYWLQIGTRALLDNHFRDAVSALKRAEELSAGFTEVHRMLSIAYAHLGDRKNADLELAKLATLGMDSNSLAVLTNKLSKYR